MVRVFQYGERTEGYRERITLVKEETKPKLELHERDLKLAHCESLEQDDEDEHAQVYLFLEQHEVGHEVRVVEHQFERMDNDKLTHQGTEELCQCASDRTCHLYVSREKQNNKILHSQFIHL